MAQDWKFGDIIHGHFIWSRTDSQGRKMWAISDSKDKMPSENKIYYDEKSVIDATSKMSRPQKTSKMDREEIIKTAIREALGKENTPKSLKVDLLRDIAKMRELLATTRATCGDEVAKSNLVHVEKMFKEFVSKISEVLFPEVF